MVNIETYDETIGRLRDEYQLDLSEVFTEDDLKDEFAKLKEGDAPQAKKNLIKNVNDFFEGSTDEVQDEVTENFSREINKVTNVDALIKVPDIVSNVRDNKVLQDAVDLKAETFIDSATTGDQLTRRRRAVAVVSDIADFEDVVEQKKVQIALENINENIRTDITLFEDLPPSKLANVLPGSGIKLTTLSADIIRTKVLAGETIDETDIDF